MFEDDRLSYMDEELQFILENFEFNPEFSEEVFFLNCFNFKIVVRRLFLPPQSLRSDHPRLLLHPALHDFKHLQKQALHPHACNPLPFKTSD